MKRRKLDKTIIEEFFLDFRFIVLLKKIFAGLRNFAGLDEKCPLAVAPINQKI